MKMKEEEKARIKIETEVIKSSPTIAYDGGMTRWRTETSFDSDRQYQDMDHQASPILAPSQLSHRTKSITSVSSIGPSQHRHSIDTPAEQPKPRPIISRHASVEQEINPLEEEKMSQLLARHEYMTKIQREMVPKHFRRPSSADRSIGLRTLKEADKIVGDNKGKDQKSNQGNHRTPTLNDFHMLAVLGEGAYGKVFQVASKADIAKGETKKTYALKLIEKKLIQLEEKVHEVHTERVVLSHLKHPTVVKMLSTFQDQTRLYFLLEQADNGTLLDLMRRERIFQHPIAQFYAAQIVLALEYLHSEQIAHRDMKPGNILLDKENHVKLIDFATAKVLNPELLARLPKRKSRLSRRQTKNSMQNFEDGQRCYSLVGTEEYVCPEILDDQDSGYGADFWSLGVIIYELYIGKTPFKGTTELITFDNISNGHWHWPPNSNAPQKARDLVEKLLVNEPNGRLGSKNFGDLKSHPYFEGIKFDNLLKQRPPVSSNYLISPKTDPLKKFFFKHKSPQKPQLKMRKSHDLDDRINNTEDYGESHHESGQLLKQIAEMDELVTSGSIKKRSSSFCNSISEKGVVLKRGQLKKKGMIFMNNRLVTINQKGHLCYYDPKQLKEPRGKIDLKSPRVEVRINGKNRDQIEITHSSKTHKPYIFKVTNNKRTGEMRSWEDAISKFTTIKH